MPIAKSLAARGASPTSPRTRPDAQDGLVVTSIAPRAVRMVALCAAASLLTVIAAQAQPPPASSLDDVVRQAAERFARTGHRAPAPHRGDPQPAAGPALSLTLDEAVKMALDKNLDIAVQRLNPQTYDFALASVKAAYLPTVTSLIGDEHQTATPTTLLTGGRQVTTHTGTVNGQLTQNLPRGGGSLNATWNNNRVFTNSFFYNYNPAFNVNLSAQYTQPLLRGLRADAARQQLAVTRVNRAISDLQLQTTITNTLTSVRPRSIWRISSWMNIRSAWRRVR